MSLTGVATNRGCGKASGDSGLRLNTSKSRISEAMLNKITIRNVIIRLAGSELSYWPSCINDHVVWWLESCVQDFSQEITNTALQKEDLKALESKFNRLKNRNNLRTAGFNPFWGKRSVHSTYCNRKGTQANTSIVDYRRPFSTKILSNNLDERVVVTELKQKIKKCKNKDGRYGKLIQIIGSVSIIKLAYLMIKSNSGIHTKGIDELTLDGINLESLQKISKNILNGTCKIRPVRQIMIPKPGKKELRPLGICSPREKIIQKSIEIVLTIIFEDVFLDCSHGFRLGRSCHTALKRLQLEIGNASCYTWVIEGDIKKCFDSIPHKLILKGLKKKVDCPATLSLIKKILNAGYILDSDLKIRKFHAKVYKSNVGIPQGTVLSPLFCNIALHELDEFIEQKLSKEFTTGKKRKANLEYQKLRYRIKRETDPKHRRKLINECLKVPSKDLYDKNFKRIFYVRYADDFVILLGVSYKDTATIRS
jgi:group II intron reverse transcriptase/maturase